MYQLDHMKQKLWSKCPGYGRRLDLRNPKYIKWSMSLNSIHKSYLVAFVTDFNFSNFIQYVNQILRFQLNLLWVHRCMVVWQMKYHFVPYLVHLFLHKYRTGGKFVLKSSAESSELSLIRTFHDENKKRTFPENEKRVPECQLIWTNFSKTNFVQTELFLQNELLKLNLVMKNFPPLRYF